MNKKKPWKLLLTLSENELRQLLKVVSETNQTIQKLLAQKLSLVEALDHYQQPSTEPTTSALLRNASIFKKKLTAALETINNQLVQEEALKQEALRRWTLAQAKKDGFEKLDKQARAAAAHTLMTNQEKSTEDTITSARNSRPTDGEQTGKI
jgi:hypothetical protein